MQQIGREYQLDFQDGTLFGNDAGEDEQPEVLASYFVDQFSFRQFLDKTVKLQIARSRKGMGKSALLSKLNFDLDAMPGPLVVVRTTGSQLVTGQIPEFTSFLEAQNYWISHICSRINAALVTKIGFAFSDTEMSLVEAAEISGFKGRNLISALLHRVKISKLPIELLSPQRTETPDALLKRATEELSNADVWFLVDDIDASYVDNEQQQLLTSSFFSACRFVAREMTGVYVRSTVRSDVWANLRANEDLDKCEQYIVDIHWNKTELKEILCKKVFSWIQRKSGTDLLFSDISISEESDAILEYAFERRLRWGSHQVPPFQPINILAAGRPRWMSQLCRLAGAEAAKHRKSKINITDINYSMPKYTRYRINDLYKEHHHQFQGLERLVQCFAGRKVRFTTDELTSHINREFIGPIGAGRIGLIDGEVYSSPFQLAHFLFKMGFIVGRVESDESSAHASFVSYSENPELLKYNSSIRRDYDWEVYPSFRQRAKSKDFADSYLVDDEE